MSTTEVALTCHLVMPGGRPDDAFLHEAAAMLRKHHGIEHSTIQIETAPEEDCAQAPPEAL